MYRVTLIFFHHFYNSEQPFGFPVTFLDDEVSPNGILKRFPGKNSLTNGKNLLTEEKIFFKRRGKVKPQALEVWP